MATQNAEQTFSELCDQAGIPCERIPTTEVGEKRPDYEIVVSGQQIIVEIKQFDPNREERKALEDLDKGRLASFNDLTLRQGVRFHNGEPFDAASVKINWDENTRLQQPFRAGQFNFTPGSRLEILAPYTVRFHFPAPDGTALVKLSTMHIGSRQFHAEHGWGEKSW